MSLNKSVKDPNQELLVVLFFEKDALSSHAFSWEHVDKNEAKVKLSYKPIVSKLLKSPVPTPDIHVNCAY